MQELQRETVNIFEDHDKRSLQANPLRSKDKEKHRGPPFASLQAHAGEVHARRAGDVQVQMSISPTSAVHKIESHVIINDTSPQLLQR